jgi:hypothetical protein
MILDPNSAGPHQLNQSYANLEKVHLANSGEVSLEFGAYNPLCCSHLFIGKLSADGSSLPGDFPPGLNRVKDAAI